VERDDAGRGGSRDGVTPAGAGRDSARRSAGRSALPYVLALALSLPVGVLWHELAGHGLTGVLCGGRIASLEILGVQLYPGPTWIGWQGHYGWCDVVGLTSATAESVVALAGSMSTWAVSVAALAVLWVRRAWFAPSERRWRRAALVALSVWWIDLLLYTLPSWGLRHSILWGPRYSEPYEAATALGVPGPLFQGLVVGVCVAQVIALAAWLVRARSPGNPPVQR
jgi:hypothetical protein